MIPIAIAAADFFVNLAIQERAAREKIAEIAITVLQSKDTTVPELKVWARGVFNQTLAAANQPLSPAGEKELDSTPLPSTS
jgi:hypothetical protein